MRTYTRQKVGTVQELHSTVSNTLPSVIPGFILRFSGCVSEFDISVTVHHIYK